MLVNSIVKEDIKEILQEKDILNKIKNTNILVTGATGLIGSMFIKTILYANKILNTNINVIALVRNSEKAESIFGTMNDITIIEMDGFDIDIKCDYILHTASATQSKFFVNYPVETIDITINGTKKMLDLAKKYNVRKMVYLSSMEMYGVPYKSGQIVDERAYGIVDPLITRSCYPESKRIAEAYCCAYFSEYNVNVVVARIAQSFGAGINLNDNRMSMQFAKSVVENRNIELHTKGKSLSNFCYLTDVIRAIMYIFVLGENGEAYNVCNDSETRSIKDIAELVAGESINVDISIPKRLESKGYAPDVNMYLSSEKLKALGWNAHVDMKEAYKRLVSYIKEEIND